MNYETILSRFNITELNEMQKASMDAIPKPNDVILVSPTGSGKTLGFLLPSLQLVDSNKKGVQILIVVPSRELAIQIEQVFKQMGTGFKINCFYGGHAIRIEEASLEHPPTVLVGTPGRIAHHLRKAKMDNSNIHTLILDEFDKSLELGFEEEMKFVIQTCRNVKKRILTSATTLKDINKIIKLNDPIQLNFTKEHEDLKSQLIVKQVKVQGDDKLEALMLLLGKIKSQSTIVFCNHRDAVNRISDQLKENGVEHGFYHGALEQIDREKVLIKLRNGSINILISTDLAARGLDIPEIEAIIHYQIPATEDVMIHRNGRTARMNAHGTAYFLLDKKEYLPPFVKEQPEEETLPKKLELPKASDWKTLYIAAGKKDKINKMDIVGMLLQKGNLHKDELGRIEVLDFSAYAAIKANKIASTLKLIREEKIKNRKIRMEIAS